MDAIKIHKNNYETIDKILSDFHGRKKLRIITLEDVKSADYWMRDVLTLTKCLGQKITFCPSFREQYRGSKYTAEGEYFTLEIRKGGIYLVDLKRGDVVNATPYAQPDGELLDSTKDCLAYHLLKWGR